LPHEVIVDPALHYEEGDPCNGDHKQNRNPSPVHFARASATIAAFVASSE
jgi:hypothetical protein